MAEQESATPRPRSPEEERIPVMQEIYDNIWFLFFVSVTIILLSYIIWGLVDMLSIPTLP